MLPASTHTIDRTRFTTRLQTFRGIVLRLFPAGKGTINTKYSPIRPCGRYASAFQKRQGPNGDGDMKAALPHFHRLAGEMLGGEDGKMLQVLVRR